MNTKKTRINWALIPNKNSLPKKALRKAIEKAGNCSQLAIVMGISRAQISQWLNKKLSKTRKLMHPFSAEAMEEAIKIRGLAKELCPRPKKVKKS